MFFGFFDFHFCLSQAKCRCLATPHFLPQLNLKRTRRDSKVEERQMILDYALRNLKRGPDGRDEIGGRLVLLPRTIIFLSRRLDVLGFLLH